MKFWGGEGGNLRAPLPLYEFLLIFFQHYKTNHKQMLPLLAVAAEGQEHLQLADHI